MNTKDISEHRNKRALLFRQIATVVICAIVVFIGSSTTVQAAFVGPSTITIDGTFTDWGTTGSPTSGAYVYQDASNSGELDGTGFAGTLGDINYFWTAISTQNGGTTPASASNRIQNFYYRLDTFGTTINQNQGYMIQLNLGAASTGYADHLLQIYFDKNVNTGKIVLYQYNTPYPAMKAFTTGSLVGKVSNVANPYSGFSGVVDANATASRATYDGSNYGWECKIPVGWYSSTYGGAITDDGTGAGAVVSAVFGSTGSLGSVGTVKDTLNNVGGTTVINYTSATTGETSFGTTSISKIAFTTSTQSITAGNVSSVMTIQTQDFTGAPSNVSSNTTVNLTSNSTGTAAFYSDSGGTNQITYVTILSGQSSANFYYKDTKAGTPTITAAENPSAGWTDATQQETITAASISKIVFTTGAQSIPAGTVSSIMTIQTQDTYNNVSNVTGSPITITLSSNSSGTATFYSDSGGTNVITSVSIGVGANSASFYYKDSAAGTPTITATESPDTGWTDATQQETITGVTPSITNTPGSYNFGTLAQSSTTPTGLTYFTVTNNGSVTVNITIGGTDLTGGVTWTLADDATPGANTYGLKAGLEGGSYNITVKKNGPYNTLVSGLAASSSQRWGLQLLAPTSFSDAGTKSGTVTLTATQA